MLPVDSPKRPPVLAAHGDQKGIALAVPIENDLVSKEDRLIAETPLTRMGSGPDKPELFSIRGVVRGQHDIVSHAEGGVDSAPVGRRRAGGVAILFMDGLQRSMDNRFLPKDLFPWRGRSTKERGPESRGRR